MAKFDEVRDQYVKVIDGILAASDLSTVSQKRIRKGIQEAVDFDITPHKASINDLILERFDEFNARQNGAGAASQKNTETAASPTPPTTNGHATTSPSPSPVKRQSESEELSEVADDAPPKKKRKPDNVDSDALIAARLQAEENARARPTRGGSTRKATPAKKRASKKKTEKKVRAEDDSDLSGSEADKPVKNTGFHKPMNLSPALSSLLGGEATLSRPQTVKRLWQYIHENNLQDPGDRRQIICDESMRAVFKQDKVHMFTMIKILNQNLYSPDE